MKFTRTNIWRLVTVWLTCWLVTYSMIVHSADLPPSASAVFQLAQHSRWYADSERLYPQVFPTSDGQSFLTVWKPDNSEPSHWIVSLHGSKGFATDDLAIWHKFLQERNIGLICLQWWNGKSDANDSYLKPHQIYREVDLILKKLGGQPRKVMLHGFSRGAANSYAVAALDAGRGRRYFSLIVASSGGVGMDFPPTREIISGRFGDHPLRGTRWITVAGAKDRNPDRDGIPGMRRTARWLNEQGAEVIASIEDTENGHGALVLNPANAKRVVDLFIE
ncbi:MAG TPA: hypothetical protein DEQ20_10700 [Desulfobulbaceae bacterium]|nr:hypothetical protein [Desulfobulbaceae bacterium]